MLHIAAFGHLSETGHDLGITDNIIECGGGMRFDPHLMKVCVCVVVCWCKNVNTMGVFVDGTLGAVYVIGSTYKASQSLCKMDHI